MRGELGRHYPGFVSDRAKWLSLDGWVAATTPGKVEILAAGPEPLVGALEMACLLGPIDALIDTLVSEQASGPVPEGFTIR